MRRGGSPLLDDWLQGIYPPLRPQAETAARGIELHPSVRALNSSMVFAFNLLLPFRERPLDLGPGLRQLAEQRIELEWTPPGRLLGEIDGEHPGEGEKATAIDGLVQGRRSDGRRVAGLVEVKLSEGGFTQCGGAVSLRNRDRAACQDARELLRRPRSA